MKFIADVMFGKITRWLRILGYDIKYLKNLDDKELISVAKKEKRILITRDLELYRFSIKNNIKTVYLKGETEIEKLVYLSKYFKIKLALNRNKSRCTKCNTLLKETKKKEEINALKQKTLAYHNKFWKCNECGKIYWHGSHWKNIKKSIKIINELT